MSEVYDKRSSRRGGTKAYLKSVTEHLYEAECRPHGVKPLWAVNQEAWASWPAVVRDMVLQANEKREWPNVKQKG